MEAFSKARKCFEKEEDSKICWLWMRRTYRIQVLPNGLVLSHPTLKIFAQDWPQMASGNSWADFRLDESDGAALDPSRLTQTTVGQNLISLPRELLNFTELCDEHNRVALVPHPRGFVEIWNLERLKNAFDE